MHFVSKPASLKALALVLVVGLAAYLRFIAVAETRIDTPIRGDAHLYVIYALNLQHFGVFSHEIPETVDVVPKSDAFVTPGYPAFLSAFFDPGNVGRSIAIIGYVQALLGTMTVLIYFILFSRFLSPAFALSGTLLIAISPHLVNASVYLLTESLFTFLLGLTLLALDTALRSSRAWPFILTGILLGATTLVRPTTLLFLGAVAFLFFVLKQPRAANLRSFVLLCIAFAVVQGGWMARNLAATGKFSDPGLTASFIQHGSYPGLMFENRPETYGYPYRFDPDNDRIRGNIDLVLESLLNRAKEDPGQYLAWFTLGKPIQYLSWNLTESVGDAFIYAPLQTPYATNPVFAWSHWLSKALHWPAVVLALASVLIALFMRGANPSAVLLAIAAAYFVGFHMIGAPFPRYSIPIRPILFGAAMFALQILVLRLAALRQERSTTGQP